MKTTRWSWVPLIILAAGLIAHPLLAGPSLPVTKPPVQSLLLLTGPNTDPAAQQGQWFIDAAGAETCRTNEFHDDLFGGTMSTAAIFGYVDSITYLMGPGTPITAFSILATIHNDTTPLAEWSNGSNSHGEQLVYQEPPYAGPMVDTKLVAEFAMLSINLLPPQFVHPYRDRTPYIQAMNWDQQAWYCWNPQDPDPTHQPFGNYYVPTWDFGTIMPGQSASRKMLFQVGAGGLLPGDPRYTAIIASFTTTNDILANRSTSLKISTWIDEIALDTGAVLEEFPLRGSDVSVFHNHASPEMLLDFGDAPDPTYPTLLANNGARHAIVPGVFMGLLIDPEPDGQPDATATGDDLANLDDEDGVTITSALFAGLTGTMDIVCSTSGFVSVWIDYDADGTWTNQAADTVFSVAAVSAGTNTFTINIPAGANIGKTMMRVRFTTQQVMLLPTGFISDGEVEDYEIDIQKEEPETIDFGDAPTPYPTLLAVNGARHVIVPGIFMGAAIDAEPDGQPDPNSLGDDNNPPLGPDDEDGVTLPAALVAGSMAQVRVVASVAGFLNAWIDWNANGTWIDPGEHVYLNTPLVPGLNVLLLPVPVPPALVAGGPHSRWRFTTYMPAAPAFVGLEVDGEVEDHEVRLEVLDFGDAPDPMYPTLLANNGARHRVPSGYWLGALAPDHEPDGQPDPQALGDDTTGAADEDGITFAGSLVRGFNAIMNVQASTNNGYLNAWIDFNQDGAWGPGEQIITDLALATGMNVVTAAVPAAAQVGQTFARFRYSSARGLGPAGLASNGEVEDMALTIWQSGPSVTLAITQIVHNAASDDMIIRWPGEAAVTYEAEYSTMQLHDTNIVWTPWGGYITAAPYEQTDTTPAQTMKFYRVVAPYAPPPP